MPSKLPRVNVTVSKEQHALLLELAKLNGGSAAGYLRQMLDAATPLLRATVPALRAASQEMNLTKAEAEKQIEEMLAALSAVGVNPQLDLLETPAKGAAHRTERSEGGRGSRARSSDA